MRVAFWLTLFGIDLLRIYRHDIGDYMHRWLVLTPLGGVRLHHILRSDAGRDLHDHPWDFVSLLLHGQYTEIREAGSAGQVYGAGSILFRKAETCHRLVLDAPVWTLVLCGPLRREWGFRTGTGWVNWRAYEGAA